VPGLRLGGLSRTGPKNCNAVTLGQSFQSPPQPPLLLLNDSFLAPSLPVSSSEALAAAWCCSHSCHNLIIDPDGMFRT